MAEKPKGCQNQSKKTPKWPEMVENGLNQLIVAGHGLKWPQNGQKWLEMVFQLGSPEHV